MATITTWKDSDLKRRMLAEVGIDVPWGLVERFTQLTRLSGSAEEAEPPDLGTPECREVGRTVPQQRG